MSPNESQVGLFVDVIGQLGKTVTTRKIGETFSISVNLMAKGGFGKKMMNVCNNQC